MSDGTEDPYVLLVGPGVSNGGLLGGNDRVIENGNAGIEVETVAEPEEALDRLDTQAVDCIACVPDLPGGDGVELLKRAGERVPSVARVLLTDGGTPPDIDLPEGVVVLTAPSSPSVDELSRTRAQLRAIASVAGEQHGDEARGEEQGDGEWSEARGEVDSSVGAGSGSGRPPPSVDYEMLVEGSAAGVVLIVDGTIQYVNRELTRTLDYDPGELIGTAPWEVAASADQTAVVERLERLERGEEDRVRFGFTGRRRDDSTIELEAHAGRVRLEGETAVALMIVDVSSRIQRRAVVTTLHEASTELITAHDPEEIAEVAVWTANHVLNLPHAAVFLADHDEELLRPTAITHVTEEDVSNTPTFEYGEGIAGNAYVEGETVVVDDAQADSRAHDDGSKVIRSYAVIPMGKHGVMTIASPNPAELDEFSVEVAGLLAATVEASLDRVERESQLRERERELERQNERLEEFASIVSHDLRGPLNVVRGNLDLARETGEEEYIDAADEASARMGRLVEDVLDLARQGEVVGTPEPVSLADAAQRAWGTVGGGSPARSGTASLAIAADCQFGADPDRLTALLENLFRNALEHAGSEVEIEVGAIGDGEGFYVADDGPGIAPDEREHVFDRGFTTSQQGTGFGLAIVEEIAVAHGWSVAIAESDDGGARFEVFGIDGGDGDGDGDDGDGDDGDGDDGGDGDGDGDDGGDDDGDE